MDKEIFLIELYLTITNQKKEFFNSDNNLYNYLYENLDKKIKIYIDGNYFDNVLDATKFLNNKKSYTYVMTVGNNNSFLEDNAIFDDIYRVLINEKKTSKKDLIDTVKFLCADYLNEEEEEVEEEEIDEKEALFDDFNDEEDNDKVASYCDYLSYAEISACCARFIVDEEFAKELLSNFYNTRDMELDVGTIDFTLMENSISTTTKENEIIFVNKLYRNIIKDIYNYVRRIGFDAEVSSEFLLSYFNEEINFSESFYQKYFGKGNIDTKQILVIQKLLLISDYYMDSLINNNDYLIDFIQTADVKHILKEFNGNMDFQERCISSFINKKDYCINNLHSNNINEKTLKKINPLFKLEKITKE